MQKLIVFCAVFAVFMATANAQQTFLAKDAKVKFDATAKASPEKIEGLSSSATCILNTATGEMAWKVLVKGFKFEKALMEEHFNENYMESDKFPNATFKGRITNLSDVNFAKDGTYNAAVNGKMNIHGVEKELTTYGTITVASGKIKLNAGFNILLADYGVKIPVVVSANIAPEAKILIDATLTPKQ